MPNNIKIVAFDCDGVLFDTNQSNRAFYKKLLEHFDMPALTEDQFKVVHSQTFENALKHLFEDNNEKVKEAIEYRKKISYKPFLKLMKIELHLISLLQKIRPEYKTAVATNRTESIYAVLNEHNVRDYFDIIVCSSDVEKPKPDPQLLNKVTENFSVSPRQMLYIGDSKLDQQAAQSCGCFFAAYDNKSLTADFHIKGLNQVIQILSNL